MAMETFAGGTGGRLVVPSMREKLGDNFMIGVTCVTDLLQGLEHVKLLDPSAEMVKAIDRMVEELSTPIPGWAADGAAGGTRFLKIARTVDHISHRLPKVTGCDETRVLALLAAVLIATPDLFVTYVSGLAKSGIVLEVDELPNGARLSVFGESIEVVLGHIQ